MRRVRRVLAAHDRPRSRGRRGQLDRREAERAVRLSALALLRWAGQHGDSGTRSAERLGVERSTLGRWGKRWVDDHLALRSRGRPTDDAGRELRRSILAVLGLMGPHVGLPPLQSCFPDVARGELVDLLRRYRHVFRQRRAWVVHTLRWRRAGAVWAMDFTEPPEPIDGLYRYVLAVRDLASGQMLLALPTTAKDAAHVGRMLEVLFRWHGAPLVIKSDNDGAFREETLRELIARHGVRILYSPPGTPSYNGAIEAGIGSLKVRAMYEAARHDRPEHWTCDDIEAAREQANRTARPEGPSEPTPHERWISRSEITQGERQAFGEAYTRAAEQEYTRLGLLPMSTLQHWDRAAIDRVAITRALIEEGFLLVRRKRIHPPISWLRQRKIS